MEGEPEETGALLERLARIDPELAGLCRHRDERVRALRQAWGRAALAVWERRRMLRAWLEELGRRLEAYAPLGDASEETLALLRDYERERARLARQVQEARAELDRALERRRDLESQERELQQAFAEMVAMEPQVTTAIDEKLELLEARDALRETEAQMAERVARRQRARVTALVAGAVAAVVAFVGLRAAGAGAAVGVVGALAVGTVALVMASRMLGGGDAGPVDEVQERRERLETELARVDRMLGNLAGESGARLAELRAHWRQFQAQREQLARRKAEVPSDEALAAKVRAAEAEWQTFQHAVRPFVARYGDPAKALQEREALERQRAEVHQTLESLAWEQWGAAPGAVDRLSPDRAGGTWAELGALAGPRTVAELGEWLGRFDPALWDEPEQEPARWATTPSEPRARLDWLDDVRSEAAGAAGTLASQVEEAERQVAELEAEATDIRRRVAPILAACGGDADRALARWQERAQHLLEMGKFRQALQTLLAARQVETPEQLAALVDQAQDGAVAASRALDELARRNAALPPVEMVSDLASASRRFEVIQTQADALRQRRKQLDEELDALREQEVRLAGQQPVNVAEAEVELGELRRRREALWFEAQALALAYRELEETVRQYQASYRERLERGATAYFEAITGRVDLDEQFAVSVVEPDGTRAVPAQLSKGAQDQLYLSLRLAIADLMASDLRLPLIFDDPFLNCDGERLGRIRETLDAIAAGGHQVLLFSHRPDFTTWGEAATCTGASPARRDSA